MSVWKDKSGDYHVGLMHRGNRVHRELPKGSTKEDAIRLQTKLRKELFRVIDLGEAPSVTCLQAVQRYLDEEVSRQKAAHITTLKAHSMEQFLAGKPLAQIAHVAETLVQELRGQSAAATINRKLSILRRTASLAYKKWGWLKEPLHEKINKIPGEKARHTYLSAAQVRKLVRSLDTKIMADAVLCAVYTGLRQGELWSLTKEHYRNGVVSLPDTKNGQPRAVPVIPKIRGAMQRWVEYDRPHPRTAYKDFEKARVVLGIPGLRFHDLRHTCASLLAAEGVDLGTIGAILGHSSTQTTKRYAHLSMEAKKKALRKIG